MSALQLVTRAGIVLAALGCVAPGAEAYSDPLSFNDPVDLGGSAGRWFTGSPVEGYGCGVCHEGGATFDLEVSGLPLSGYTPGATYEVTVRWPVQLAHVAGTLEFTDDAQQTAGTVGLPPPESYTPDELCSGDELGFPATQVDEALDGRQIATMAECGARVMRVQWRAPQAAVGEVWFSAALAQVDDDDTPAGDGVAMARHALTAEGQPAPSSQVGRGAGCSATAGGALGGLWAPWISLAWLEARRQGRRR